jgi:hypothetical protein
MAARSKESDLGVSARPPGCYVIAGAAAVTPAAEEAVHAVEQHREDVPYNFWGRETVTIRVNITPQTKSCESFRPIRPAAASMESSCDSRESICASESEDFPFSNSLSWRSCSAISARYRT